MALNDNNQFRTQHIRSRLAGTDYISLCALSKYPPPVRPLEKAKGFDLKLSGAINHLHTLKCPGMAAIAINQFSTLINSSAPVARSLEGLQSDSGLIEFSGGRIRF